MTQEIKSASEGIPLQGPMPLWRFREKITGGPARFLRSACCHAPVWQTREPEPDLFPVLCGACWRELGAPGAEDLHPSTIDFAITVDTSRFDAAMEGIQAELLRLSERWNR